MIFFMFLEYFPEKLQPSIRSIRSFDVHEQFTESSYVTTLSIDNS